MNDEQRVIDLSVEVPGTPEQVRLVTGDGAPPLAGTVQRALRTATTSTYSLLLDEPAPGTAFVTAEAAGDASAISVYLYLYGDAGAAAPDAWTPFLAERFPAPAS